MTTSPASIDHGNTVPVVDVEPTDQSLATATKALAINSHTSVTTSPEPVVLSPAADAFKTFSSSSSPIPEAHPPPPEVERIETLHPQPITPITPPSIVAPINAAPETPVNHQSRPAAANDHPPPSDPRVETLLAIFPSFDPSILQYVLEDVNWDQDRAVDVLLGMSDPTHVPQTRVPDTVRSSEHYNRNKGLSFGSRLRRNRMHSLRVD